MPNSVTIRRARSVAFSMSFEAAGRRVPEDQALGGGAAQHAGDLVLELGLGLEVAVLGRQAHRVAEGHPAADDVTLATGSHLGRMRWTTAWPPSW